MVPEYYNWLASIAERDQALINLAVMALVLLVAWVSTYVLEDTRLIPRRLASGMRVLYRLGGLPLYVLTLFAHWIF